MAGLLLTGAALLDLGSGEVRGGSSVRVEGDRIVEVATEGELTAGEEVTRIDCGGLTLLPGLIDDQLEIVQFVRADDR